MLLQTAGITLIREKLDTIVREILWLLEIVIRDLQIYTIHTFIHSLPLRDVQSMQHPFEVYCYTEPHSSSKVKQRIWFE